MKTIASMIAQELNVKESQVNATIALIDEGSTIPFIARYRKEKTGGLDDIQLRQLDERLKYLKELGERKNAIIKSIEEQGKLNDALKTKILDTKTKTILEDLYLPYKPKRSSKALVAKDAGLEPLAQALYKDPTIDPETEAQNYLNPEKNITDTKSALEGARQILMEQFSQDASVIGQLRDTMWEQIFIDCKVEEGKENTGCKFSDYFNYSEKMSKIPSHRALAMIRGRNENILQINLKFPQDEQQPPHTPSIGEQIIARHFKIYNQHRAADQWLLDVVKRTWKIKLFIKLELELISRLRADAEIQAIHVFSENLKDLLMAAPAGRKTTMGLDPGLRTGVKVAVVDDTGKLLDTATIYPHVPQKQWNESIQQLSHLIQQHQVSLISIGNGTASRETEKLVTDLCQQQPSFKLEKVVVSEAGASVYSASILAAQEFPDIDVSIRGAISIARRVQDPLAELVKIEPKAIGVGQYQHDLNQTRLANSLDVVTEDCVNAVGVDINTASVPLLTKVSGLNPAIAKNIVDYRELNGRFKNRQEFKSVPRLGEKTFEQAAGFLRITDGENPLDTSAVHPESYAIVTAIAKQHHKKIQNIIGDQDFIKNLNASDYINQSVGLITIKDIFNELIKPGRDPRPVFKTVQFKENVETMNDLKLGMILQGAVTNVTNFGAFVDIGVHQDGLVHISALSDRFIASPRDVVKTGDIVKVKVIEVDTHRKRIALTMNMKQDNAAEKKPTQNTKTNTVHHKHSKASHQNNPSTPSAMEQALKSALMNGRS